MCVGAAAAGMGRGGGKADGFRLLQLLAALPAPPALSCTTLVQELNDTLGPRLGQVSDLIPRPRPAQLNSATAVLAICRLLGKGRG